MNLTKEEGLTNERSPVVETCIDQRSKALSLSDEHCDETERGVTGRDSYFESPAVEQPVLFMRMNKQHNQR